MHLYYSFHGLLILLVGLLSGFPFAQSIKSKNGREVAWRVVHAGGASAGLMLIAVGVITQQFELGPLNAFIYYLFIFGTYTLVGGMVLAAITGQRGLDKKNHNIYNKIVYILYGLGAIGSLLAMLALISLSGREILNF